MKTTYDLRAADWSAFPVRDGIKLRGVEGNITIQDSLTDEMATRLQRSLARCLQLPDHAQQGWSITELMRLRQDVRDHNMLLGEISEEVLGLIDGYARLIEERSGE